MSDAEAAGATIGVLLVFGGILIITVIVHFIFGKIAGRVTCAVLTAAAIVSWILQAGEAGAPTLGNPDTSVYEAAMPALPSFEGVPTPDTGASRRGAR